MITLSKYPIEQVRLDFPILNEKIFGKSLVYLDNGATTQKPTAVINAMSDYYSSYNSNVHRGVHFLSQKATDAEEQARNTIARFINAAHDHEIIFTKGTTEGINLVAHSFAKKYVQAGDEIIVTEMEHHANIIPWQMACEERGAVLKVIPIDTEGNLRLEVLPQLLNKKTKLLAFTWVSNTLGTVNPIEEIIQAAHAANVPVLVDAAQGIQHIPIDVRALDIDFLVFSGHKIYGPTGIGVLYGKEQFLNEMPPYQTGGSMIKQVSFKGTTFAGLPFKFEAGTPHIAGIVGLGAAVSYLSNLGLDAVMEHEHNLLHYAENQLQQIEAINIIGRAKNKSATISFLVGQLHPFDVGELLDKQGIAVRTGQHCCQPIMEAFAIPGTVRASFALYNTTEEIDIFVQALKKAIIMLS